MTKLSNFSSFILNNQKLVPEIIDTSTLKLKITVNRVQLEREIFKLQPGKEKNSKKNFLLLVAYKGEDIDASHKIKSRYTSFIIKSKKHKTLLKTKVNKSLFLPRLFPFPNALAVINVYIIESNVDKLEKSTLCLASLDLGQNYKKLCAFNKMNFYDLFFPSYNNLVAGKVELCVESTNKFNVDVPAVFLQLNKTDSENEEITNSTDDDRTVTSNFNQHYFTTSDKLSTSSTSYEDFEYEHFSSFWFSKKFLNLDAREIIQRLEKPLKNISTAFKNIMLHDFAQKKKSWLSKFNRSLDEVAFSHSEAFIKLRQNKSEFIDIQVTQAIRSLGISSFFSNVATIFAKSIILNELFLKNNLFLENTEKMRKRSNSTLKTETTLSKESFFTDPGSYYSSDLDSFSSSNLSFVSNHKIYDNVNKEAKIFSAAKIYKKLPDDHPFSIFKFFKNDELYASSYSLNFGGLLGILVMGDENTSMEEAAKIYGLEVQAHNVVNGAIMRLKATSVLKSKIDTLESHENFGTILCVTLITNVDYKGFRVVVMPLPMKPPAIFSWPCSLSLPIFQEVLDIERDLKIDNILKPSFLCRQSETVSLTILIQLDASDSSKMIFYRLHSLIMQHKALRQHIEKLEIKNALKKDKRQLYSYKADDLFNKYNPSTFFRITTDCSRILCELESMPPHSPYDSVSLTNYLHRKGIKCKLLGALANQTRASWLQHLFIVDILGRTLKKIFRDCVRCLALYLMRQKQKELGIKSFKKNIIKECVEQLIRIMPMPIWVSKLLLNKDPYEINLKKNNWRTFTIVDILALNLFNLTLGDSVLSEEFWKCILANWCKKFYYVNDTLISQHHISLPALYLALQHHLGLMMFPCAAALRNRLGKAEGYPLMPSDMKCWVSCVSRSVLSLVIAMKTYDYVRKPQSIKLTTKEYPEQILDSISVQKCVSNIIYSQLIAAHDINFFMTCFLKVTKKRNCSKLFKTLDSYDKIQLENWALPNSFLKLVGFSMSLEMWNFAKSLCYKILDFYPEAHASSIFCRLMLILIEEHGGFSPLPNLQIMNQTEVCVNSLLAHWNGFHPAIVDIGLTNAWLAYVRNNWAECQGNLEITVIHALFISTRFQRINVPPFYDQLRMLKYNYKMCSIPRPPPNIRIAGILRLLGNLNLLRMVQWYEENEHFYKEEQKLIFANSACKYFEVALDTYDFHMGKNSLLVATCLYELALGINLLTQLKNEHSNNILIEKAVQFVSEALKLQVKILGKNHVESISSGILLGNLLENQKRYYRCLSVYEAVIRNTLARKNIFFANLLYRPNNEFSRLLWCLNDKTFYGNFENKKSRLETKNIVTPNEKSLGSHFFATPLPSLSRIKEEIWVIYINHVMKKDITYRVFSLFLMLDFVGKEEYKLRLSTEIRELEKLSHIHSSKSFFTWLISLSNSSEVKILCYIQNYPYRMSKDCLLEHVDKLFWESNGECHVESNTEKFVINVLDKAEKTIFDMHRQLLNGERYESYRLKEAKDRKLNSELFKEIKLSENGMVNQLFEQKYKKLDNSINLDVLNSYVREGLLNEDVKDIIQDKQQNDYYKKQALFDFAHEKSRVRLPLNLQCKELDIIANLLFYFLNIEDWKNIFKEKLFSKEANDNGKETRVSIINDITYTDFEIVDEI